MTPSNPSNNQPFIFRILDSLGISHQVVPVDHFHNSLAGQTVSLIINGTEVEIEPADVPNLIRALADPDSTPTDDSTKLVTSGGVKTALDGKADAAATTAALAAKQDTLTFDSTPTLNSTNPVTSGGVHVAIEEKFQGIVPEIRTIESPDSMNLNTLGMTPPSILRFIIQNSGSSAIPFRDMFYSENLPVHISGEDTLEVGSHEYVMVSIFRENSSEHVHFNCYFVLFEGIFSE